MLDRILHREPPPSLPPTDERIDLDEVARREHVQRAVGRAGLAVRRAEQAMRVLDRERELLQGRGR